MRFLILFLLPALALSLPNVPFLSRQSDCPTLMDQDPPVQNRIINGDTASPKILPYIVAFIVSLAGFRQHLCSGTLITPTHILTAAHCAPPDGAPLFALIGAKDTSDSSSAIPVDRFLSHSKYSILDEDTQKYDIAVAVLSRPASGSLMPVNVVPDIPKSDTALRSIGYGLTTFVEQPDPTRVGDCRQVDMPAMTDSECKNLYGLLDDKYEVCAGYVNEKLCMPCKGDSGGPVIQYDGDTPIVVGIISRVTAECSWPGFQIMIRAGAYEDWLDAAAPGYKKSSADIGESAGDGTNVGLIVGVALGVLAVVVVIVVGVVFWRRRRSKGETIAPQNTQQVGVTPSSPPGSPLGGVPVMGTPPQGSVPTTGVPVVSTTPPGPPATGVPVVSTTPPGPPLSGVPIVNTTPPGPPVSTQADGLYSTAVPPQIYSPQTQAPPRADTTRRLTVH